MKKIFTRLIVLFFTLGLMFACTKEVDISPYLRVVAVADFDAVIQVPNNLTVKFTSKSKNAKSIIWDFGDQSAVSNDAEVTHTYAQPGTYKVTLSIKSSTGYESTKGMDVTVTPVDIIPSINFSYAEDLANPLKIKFTNQSQNGISFSWNFGDQSAVSTIASPEHTFAANGRYEVTLTAKSSTGNENSRTISIRVPKLTVPEIITIANPGFELDPKDSYVITGWNPVKVSYPGSPGWGGFFISEKPHTGTRALEFWTPANPANTHDLAYVGSVTQTISGLEDGKYTFKIWINGQGMQNMFLSANGGEADVKKAVNETAGFTQLSLDFNVVGGVAKIGVLMDRPQDLLVAPRAFLADDAELWINP